MTHSERPLRIVRFTDIVASTERAAELGDRAWRQTLAEFHAIARREIRTALALLDDPLMPAEFKPAGLYRLSHASMSIPFERLAPDTAG